MRIMTFIVLSILLSSCGKSGALYMPTQDRDTDNGEMDGSYIRGR